MGEISVNNSRKSLPQNISQLSFCNTSKYGNGKETFALPKFFVLRAI